MLRKSRRDDSFRVIRHNARVHLQQSPCNPIRDPILVGAHLKPRRLRLREEVFMAPLPSEWSVLPKN